MRFRTSFLITLGFHLLILAVDKGAGFIILKILEDAPDEKGGLALLTNLPPILMAVSNLGLASSLVYFTKRGEVAASTAGKTTATVAIVWGFSIALLAFVVIRIWSMLDPDAGQPAYSLLIPVLVMPPFMLLISYRNSIQLVLNRIFGYNLVHLIQSASFLPLFLLIYFVMSDGAAYHAGVYARFVPVVILAFALIWYLRREVPIRPGFDRKFFGKALSYGWRANISSTLAYLNHRLDLYLLFVLFLVTGDGEAQAEVAFYGLAVTLAELIWHFPEAMRDLMFSKVAGLSKDEARRFTPVVCRNSLLICLLAGVGIWLVHDPLLTLYMPDKWTTLWGPKVTPALAWLLPGTVCYTIVKVLRADIMARGHVNAGIVLVSIVFATMMVGDYFLIPEGGATGAAIASTIAYGVGAVVTMWFYTRVTGVSPSELLFIHREDLSHYRDLLTRLPIVGKKSNVERVP